MEISGVEGVNKALDCAKVAVNIRGRRVNALVDSCASVSIISLELINKYGLSFKDDVSTEIMSIFGSSTTIKGISTFKMRIGPRIYQCKALVLQDSIYPLLLGLDWLLENKCNLNFDKMVLEFPDGQWNPINVEREVRRALPVRSKFDFILQQGERAIIPVKIPELNKVIDVDGVVDSLKDSDEPWTIARAIIKVKQGISSLEILNVGNGPWKVRKNQVVGYFEYEPSFANAILVASAIVVEDVSQRIMKEDLSRKDSSCRPINGNGVRSLASNNTSLSLHVREKNNSSYLQKEELINDCSRVKMKSANNINTRKGYSSNGRKNENLKLMSKAVLGLRKNVAFATKEAEEYKLNDEELNKVIGHLPDPKLLKLKDLLLKFRRIFALNNNQPGTTNVVEHEINTEGSQPIAQAPYRSNPEKRREIQNQVQSLLESGQIEESNSPWASPVLLVPKKDGGWRMCVDYRKLNTVTKKVSYPIPRTEDTFDYLLQAKWFSKMDAASGFWQVPVERSSKEKTAMITPDGLFQWKVMPFGLCNAPATFQRLMDCVLSGLKWKECLVYLDDILIFSKTWEEHLVHLTHVFEKLEKASISLKLSKCEFGKNEIQFLGHVVKDQMLLPDERNVDAVLKFPVPKDLTGVRGFLGLVGHYRRFIPKFSDKSQPLRLLLKKETPFTWGIKQQKAFEELRDLITSKPVLGLPDFSKPFRLSTDASNIGISAILSQMDETGKEMHVIGYRSRALRGAEENYSTIEKEMLAIVYGLQKFDYYLMGSLLPFEIVTDHCHASA